MTEQWKKLIAIRDNAQAVVDETLSLAAEIAGETERVLHYDDFRWLGTASKRVGHGVDGIMSRCPK